MQKLNTKIDSWFIDMPKETDKIQVSVIFDSGYASEEMGKEGTTHLLEHYIVGLLDDCLKKEVYLNGWTSNEYLELYLETSKKNLDKHISKFLDILSSPNFDREDILNRERIALVNEIQSKVNSGSTRAFWSNTELLLGKDSPYTRSYEDETKNAREANLKILEKSFNEIKARKIRLVIGGHGLNEEELLLIVKAINKRFSESEEELKYEDCKLTSKEISQREIDNIKGSYVEFIFPGISSSEDIKNKICLNKVCRLFVDMQYGPIFEKLRNEGIYGLDYSASFYKEFGLIGFDSHVPKSSANSLIRIFRETLEEYLKEGVSEETLSEDKQKIREANRDRWDSNSDRYEWAVDDIRSSGRIYTPEDIEDIVKEITPEYLSQIAKEYLNLDKLRILISGEIVPESDLK